MASLIEKLGPLRRVIGEKWDEHGIRFEVYECGHQRLPKQDRMGPTNAYRRRCRKCRPAATKR